MLCGIPTSGKSSFIDKVRQNPLWSEAFILSTDNYIEAIAKSTNKTYTEVFQDNIKKATEDLEAQLYYATRTGKYIIWDQTNLTPSVRKEKLSKVPDWYKKTAIWFEITLEDALQRNEKREGKYIPKSVMKRMFHQFVKPTENEGFVEVKNGTINEA